MMIFSTKLSHSWGSPPRRKQILQCAINTVDMIKTIIKQQSQNSAKIIAEPHSFYSSIVTTMVQEIYPM